MNRLKFRIWDQEKKKMIYPDDLSTLGSYLILVDSNKTTKEFIFQQFTGALDDDGKEIYEGDICKAYKANSYLKGYVEVIWDDKHNRWGYKNSKYQIGSRGNLSCRVIGNIMEKVKI